jgi:hypothetical protein
MKKNDWIILVVTGVYSYFFYNEMLGLNLSLFTLVLLIAAIIKDRELLKNRNWMAVAGFSLMASCSLAYFGNMLSILAVEFSLLILAGMSVSRNGSILIAYFHGFYSLIVSCGDDMRFMRDRYRSNSRNLPSQKRLLLIAIPIIISFVFIGLYRASNPIFEAITNKINFDWISFSWIFFTLVGMWAIYGFFNAKFVSVIKDFDEPESMKVDRNQKSEYHLFGKIISVVDENFSAKLLFVMLNLVILILNLGDLNFIFVDQTLPENFTFAQFLHQGVGTLIFSILISIAIVLFYFRGELNFLSQNKFVKILAYTWLLQNIVMLLSVGFKNSIYIDLYGLTYKRIGVYIYIFLTFIGLVSTILKIYLVKKNLFLFRMNGWSFYLVLVFSTLLNWDQMIVNNNKSLDKEIDIYYLLSLSDATLPSLQKMERNIKNPNERKYYHKLLNRKITKFRYRQSQKTWKSWSYLNAKVENEMNYYAFLKK